MEERSFFGELKRRNVYKVAAAYIVISWLIIQAASILFPTFDAPQWVMKVFVAVLVLGFLPALVFAWAFEITPEGIKRESEIAADRSIAHHTGRKIVAITVVFAVIAAGLLLFQIFRPKVVTGAAAAPVKTLIPETPVVVPEKSIAVLPFENLSRDPDNAYFADGIQDEILTRLSKIAALKVISRTSTQKYKSAPENLRQVGKELGVANLLEGSVQKVANSTHINVQLIHAATDEHLWAESYNRRLDDVFGVEGEVATAIADQLKATLTGAEEKAVTEKPTQNVAAYEAYLRGVSIEHSQYGYNAYAEAVRNYAQAVQLDPNFALAVSRLAILRSFLFFNGVDPATNSPGAVKEAADRAMALAPNAGESWIAQGAYRYRVLRDFEGAVTAFRRAETLSPNNSYLLRNLAFVLRRLGRWQEAESEFKKALDLDPRDVSLLCSMGGEFYNYLRRFDDACAVLDRALEISPDSDTAHAQKANVFQSQGRVHEAAQEIARLPADASDDDFVIGSRVTQAIYERRFDVAIDVVERKVRAIPAGQPIDSELRAIVAQVGFCQDWMGRGEEARRTFSHLVEMIKPTPDTVVLPEANGLPSTLALAYAGLGQKDKALQQAQQAVKDYDNDAVIKPFALTTLAQIQAHFGDLDSAIAGIPHLLEVPAGVTRADLKYNPFWDPLRKDPRFQKLCQQPNK
ncbi:MAG TPA: tetratricopeptide repeat protein [Chthoniobacterales bacterium]|jgi:TolB-like protein